jgi:hypothetical protein
MNVRTLTDSGIADFAAYLAALKGDPKLPPPVHLLSDQKGSESVPGRSTVEQRIFATRFELAKYLHERFADREIPNLDRHRGLWTWLTLLYFDQLCPVVGRGERKVGESPSYVPEFNDNRRYYRHLLYGPFAIYRLHQQEVECLEALLCDRINVGTSEFFRLFIENQQLLASKTVVRVATILYFDSTKKTMKRGTGAKNNGGMRRYIDFMQQIMLTYDIATTDTIFLLSILPKEFRKFQQA